MGSITTGVGLISGIDTAALIDSLLQLEAAPKFRLERRIATLQAQQTAMLDVNARLLNLKNIAASFRANLIFRAAQVTSNDEEVLSATASASAQPGSYSFIVKRLVSTSQAISKGFTDFDSSPLNLENLSFEFGKGGLSSTADLEELNGGNGVRRGSIKITDRTGSSATIDLSDAISLDEVVDRINQAGGAQVTAAVDGDHLVITDDTGDTATNLKVENSSGSFTATDLGIAQDVAASTITGTNISYLSDSTSLSLLNDGNGVLIRDFVTDLNIDVNGTPYAVDLGRQDDPILTTTLLSDLNSGAGITINADGDDPDLKIVDRKGEEYEVELTGATTVQNLINRVSQATAGMVTLEIAPGDDRLRIVDNTGEPSGLLKVLGAGVNGTETAEDLGILNEDGVDAASFDGTMIQNAAHTPRVATIGELLDRINTHADLAGIVEARIDSDGVSLEIVSLLGDTVTILGGAGDSSPQSDSIKTKTLENLGFTDGQSTTSRIDGERLIAALGSVLIDNLNGGAGLTQGPPGGPQALSGATLLDELLSGAGLRTNENQSSYDIEITDRNNVNYQIEIDDLTTVQDLIDRVASDTGGNVTFTVEDNALRATDHTGGTSKFKIEDMNGSNAGEDFGILVDANVDTVIGIDTMPIYSSGSASIDITDRTGTTTTIDLTQAESISEIITAINDSGAGVVASLNSTGNGLLITDTTGATASNLVIADNNGTYAAELNIEADVADDEIRGGNLQLKYVSLGQSLSSLNYGRGVGTGTFRISDGLGNTATVDIGNDSKSLYDVVNEINTRGLAVLARVNDNGDGIVIEEDTVALGGENPFVKIKVDALSGTTAKDLNIIGEAENVEGGPAGGARIDGSYERVVDVTATDTLEEIVDTINESGIPVSATIVNTGSGSNPYRISFTSGISGSNGDLFIDTGDIDLGISTVNEGRDAVAFFGDDPATAFLLRSSSNTLKNVVQGVTIDLLATSDEAVTITVGRDIDKMVETAQNLVTAFNDAIQRIDQYDFFDVDSEERGVLLNNPTTSLVRSALLRAAQQRAEGVDTQYQFLRQVGITIGANSSLEIDDTKFREALDNDLSAVENLIAAFESTPPGITEIEPGITVVETDDTVTARGVAQIFDDLLDQLTNPFTGAVTLADTNFNDLIDIAQDRIEVIDGRLAARRQQLERQFRAMELALARIQNQGQSLASLAGNLALLQNGV